MTPFPKALRGRGFVVFAMLLSMSAGPNLSAQQSDGQVWAAGDAEDGMDFPAHDPNGFARNLPRRRNQTLVQVVVLVLLLGSVWVVVRPRTDFTIVAKGESIAIRGRIPLARRPEISHFFKQELAVEGRLKVSGQWIGNRRLRLRFRGPASASQQQQIRNFLLATLSR